MDLRLALIRERTSSFTPAKLAFSPPSVITRITCRPGCASTDTTATAPIRGGGRCGRLRAMRLAANVFDLWVFQRTPEGVVFLLLYTSIEKAARHFNGGRFWQIPSDFAAEGESITEAIERVLHHHGLRPTSIWAGEHAYLIYNRRFAEMQAIGVFAAEVDDAAGRVVPSAHAEHAWLPFEACLERVHFRGLKDGLRSVHEFITGVPEPARELCLYPARHR